MDQNPRRPLALVTGASSGIGHAFAERLAADGHDLIVVGRRVGRLEALAACLPDSAVQVVVADLASEDGIGEVAALCEDRPLSMLVNNAGVAHYMPLPELPLEKARKYDQPLTALVVRRPGVTVAQAAEELRVDATALYPVIRRLEARGELAKHGRGLQPIPRAGGASSKGDALEGLWCEQGHWWNRTRAHGPKPKRCPEHR